MLTILIFLFTLSFFLCTSKKKIWINRLPSGPRGMPIFGNLLQISTRPYLNLHEWAKQHGKMFTIRLAHVPVLVLNDKDVMKDLLGRMPATGRYPTELLTMISWYGNYGLLTAEGKIWQEQKQFCFRALREFGFGKHTWMEPMILEQLDELCGWIETEQKSCGRVDLKKTLHINASSAIWTMVTGERKNSRHTKIVGLSREWVSRIQIVIETGLFVFPWLKYFAPVTSGYRDLKRVCEEIRESVETYFKEQKMTKKNGEAPRHMIDVYIDKVEGCTDPESTFYGETGWKHAFSSVTMLLIASADGTGTLLKWLVFFLSAHPEAQRKVHQEIDEIIGKIRNPSFADRANMPYMEAVILETFRYASQATVGGFVRLLEDVSFQGYQLPKGLIILPNLYHVHHDKNIWGDPENFRPERFLEEGGSKLKEFVVAFQIGKRSCPGEFFAKDVMYLFATRLFQKYSFSVDSSIPNVTDYLEPGSTGIILYPKLLPVVVAPRS